MAVCNIFGELKKPTGTFLTFSQYTESITNIQQKVIPSKFVAININAQNAKTELTNSSIPKTLQNYYENGVAVIKNKHAWKNDYSKDLFWRTMYDHFITNEDIKYIGDINIQSYEEYGDIGYSEIYCYIPTESECMVYSGLTPSNEIDTYETNKQYIEGYDDSESELVDWIKIDKIAYKISKDPEMDESGRIWYDRLSGTKIPNQSLFNFNTIVVLYNVIDRDGNILQSNQPMGIYFTGRCDDNHNITNAATKYVSNPEIYDQGTSYGLRICTKHVTSSSDPIIKEFQINQDSKSELNYALSQMSQSQIKMDEVINHTYNCVQNYKDLAAIFKNSKTNVPYIKLINGKEYWFVNGRRVSSAYIDNGEIEYVNSINIDANIYEKTDDGKLRKIDAVSIMDLLDGDKQITIKWKIKKGDVILDDKYINNISLKLPAGEITGYEKISKNSEDEYCVDITIPKYGENINQVMENYLISVTLSDGQVITERVGYIRTFPSFVGLCSDPKSVIYNYLIKRPNSFGDSQFANADRSLDAFLTLEAKSYEENAKIDQKYIYEYNNEDSYYIFYMYPSTDVIGHKLGSQEVKEVPIYNYRPLTSIEDSIGITDIDDFNKNINELVSEPHNYYPNVVLKFKNRDIDYNILYNMYISKNQMMPTKNGELTFE